MLATRPAPFYPALEHTADIAPCPPPTSVSSTTCRSSLSVHALALCSRALEPARTHTDEGPMTHAVHKPNAPRLQTEKTFFILNLESVQLCPSAVLPHAISAQNCAEFEVKHKSNSSWTHSNPGTWKLVLILKWKTDGLAREGSLAKDSTKIWNGLYCITWNTILRIPDPESKTISGDSGVGREGPAGAIWHAQIM